MNDPSHSQNLAVCRRAGYLRFPFLLPVLVAVIGVVLSGRAEAQTFTTLYNFKGGSEGGSPSGLICSDTVLYGMTGFGGSGGRLGYGTIFAVNIDGTGYTNLHSFSFSDGTSSRSRMVLSGTTLYGTTPGGGAFGNGTVFKVNTDGTSFTSLHSFTALSTNSPASFTNSDGYSPHGGLVLDGGTLYGAAESGGTSGAGTIFKLNADGTGFTTLYNFSTVNSNSSGFWTNSDGTSPEAVLVATGGTLYGAAGGGGDYGKGTIFKLNADGTGFTNLHSFRGIDGDGPSAGLLLSADTLYGVASSAGSSNHGTVFKLNTDGTGFMTLHSFNGSDGDYPVSPVVLLGDTLYGTTQDGGNSGDGAVFAIRTDGSGFAKLHDFTQTTAPDDTNSDGAFPSELVLWGITLYGSAIRGGVYFTYVPGPLGGPTGNGTVFSLTIPPQLTITSAAENVILSWPTNFTGFTLQSTTNLASPLWATNLTPPVAVNGLNTVTNPISGTQQFFRLSQ
jgi:uncharacterized repeat protein (TIGR03803 family)